MAAVLLLAGCGARRDGGSLAEDVRARYAAMDGCTARVEAAVVRDGETRRYTLDIERCGDETRVTVLEPEALAGVGAVVSGDALTLEFDGMILDAGSGIPGVSAVNAADIVFRAAAEGWITERNTERFGDTDALRLCMETELDGETLPVTGWFDEALAPLYAEIESGGEVLAYLEFTSFAFCDMINADGS